MLHLRGNEAPEAHQILTTIVQLTSDKVHQVNRWETMKLGCRKRAVYMDLELTNTVALVRGTVGNCGVLLLIAKETAAKLET
jgi:hypothetical protein